MLIETGVLLGKKGLQESSHPLTFPQFEMAGKGGEVSSAYDTCIKKDHSSIW